MINLNYTSIKRNDFVIKKSLSAFLAGIHLLSSVSTTTFASGSKHIAPPQKPTTYRSGSLSLQKRKIAAQKVFLVALLCAMGTNVYIKFQREQTVQNLNFTVFGIGNLFIQDLKPSQNRLQMGNLLEFLTNSKAAIDFKYNLRPRSLILDCVKINNYFLTQNEIYKIGEKVLEFIYVKKRTAYLNHSIHKMVNLTEDVLFRQNILNIFGEILNPIPHECRNVLSFYSLQLNRDSRKFEPLKDIHHIYYLQNHPDKSQKVIFCYQKAFLVGILSVLEIDMQVRKPSKSFHEFKDHILMCSFNGENVYSETTKKTLKCIENMIYTTRRLFPPEKININIEEFGYIIPTEVTIGGITLNEIDIFNLGQRFYSLVQKNFCQIIKDCPNAEVINLDKTKNFTENIKQEFKQYTGRDFPNLNS